MYEFDRQRSRIRTFTRNSQHGLRKIHSVDYDAVFIQRDRDAPCPACQFQNPGAEPLSQVEPERHIRLRVIQISRELGLVDSPIKEYVIRAVGPDRVPRTSVQRTPRSYGSRTMPTESSASCLGGSIVCRLTLWTEQSKCKQLRAQSGCFIEQPSLPSGPFQSISYFRYEASVPG